jgi:hypothetical protein
MADKKKPSKASLEYVRPEPGTFNLVAFEGVEFRFRKITIDDEAWAKEHFGKTIWEIINESSVEAAQVCRLYFHFLEDGFKALFPPERVEVVDYENGGKKEELLNGPKKFMRAIDGGSLTELTLIALAFAKTVFASRPISDLPEDVKKKVMELVKSQKPAAKEPAAKEPEKPAEANP